MVTLAQKIPVTGGDLFVSSSLARPQGERAGSLSVVVFDAVSGRTAAGHLPSDTAAVNGQEDAVRASWTNAHNLEAMEDVALQTATLFFTCTAARVALQTL